MKYTVSALFGLVAIAAAQTSNCVAQDNACRVAPSANLSTCSANKGTCQTTCYSTYNTCRVAPDANRATCASQYAACLGENPFASNGTNTITPAAPVSSATVSVGPVVTARPCVEADSACRAAPDANRAACTAYNAVCRAACDTTYDSCRVGANANRATCAAQYAGCLGENPFAANGTNTVTPAANNGSAVVTQVVTSFTTYCPVATTLTFNNKVYTVSTATTLTITDCPCTITSTRSASSTMSTSPATNATRSVPPVAIYTGAASRWAVGGSSAMAALGSFFFLF